MTMGRSDVTAIFTGRRIHHAAIHTAVAAATAPLKPKLRYSSKIVTKKKTGPAIILIH